MCIILALLIAININKDSSNQNNNDVQLTYTKEDLINTTYKSKEGATLSFTIDGYNLEIGKR